MPYATLSSPPVVGTVDVDGARLAYELSGTSDDHSSPIVLLHAGIADSRMWDSQITALSERYRVVRYDFRGFGRSGLASGPFSARADLIALLDALEIERAHLVGVSMGGACAVDVALETPDRVASLVVCGARPSGQEASPELIRAWAEVDAAEEAGDLELAVELELRMWVDGRLRGPAGVDPAVRESVREMNSAIFARGNQAQPRPLDPPALTRLHEITAPTLVMVGDRDLHDVLAGAHLLAAGIPGAIRQTIPGAAHLVNMECPDAFNQAVLDFLSRVETTAG